MPSDTPEVEILESFGSGRYKVDIEGGGVVRLDLKDGRCSRKKCRGTCWHIDALEQHIQSLKKTAAYPEDSLRPRRAYDHRYGMNSLSVEPEEERGSSINSSSPSELSGDHIGDYSDETTRFAGTSERDEFLKEYLKGKNSTGQSSTEEERVKSRSTAGQSSSKDQHIRSDSTVEQSASENPRLRNMSTKGQSPNKEHVDQPAAGLPDPKMKDPALRPGSAPPDFAPDKDRIEMSRIESTESTTDTTSSADSKQSQTEQPGLGLQDVVVLSVIFIFIVLIIYLF